MGTLAPAAAPAAGGDAAPAAAGGGGGVAAAGGVPQVGWGSMAGAVCGKRQTYADLLLMPLDLPTTDITTLRPSSNPNPSSTPRQGASGSSESWWGGQSNPVHEGIKAKLGSAFGGDFLGTAEKWWTSTSHAVHEQIKKLSDVVPGLLGGR